ncbi:NLR family CARD domain-containing protein 4-like isoform X1 [Lytechinus variegatus]|uniref:NLR family CARD domain-containing protein 4-like isoform X1 n=1 Tax=Lytechinus variegatus TaxID=7654 RepID=UPI001BB1833C|nr:NLR family CARD domain-containing protein 4-like isoform X1 [Lytechinus variegatus]XP_041465128.1 NLR family CARD domain-containing protein 4-like isoform X1 [Lytechinus variegatus]
MANLNPDESNSDISAPSCSEDTRDDSPSETLSDLELNLISQKIPRHRWEELGLRLGFDGVQLECIRHNNKHEPPQRAIYDMLHQWRRNHSGETLREALLQALIDTRLKEIAETIDDGVVTSHSLDLDLEQLRKELVNFYLSDMCKIKFIPWDEESYVDLQKFYVRLSLVVQNASTFLNGPKTLRPLQDSHDGIFSSSNSNDRQPMRLLLEGEAGMGKTTLVAKLAYDWAIRNDSSPLKDIPLFLAIPFRKWNPEWSIGNAVRKCLLASDSKITARQIDHYMKSNPGAAKVVLEGYDEAKFSIADAKASGRIGCILRNEELRENQILVTSRPWRVVDFKSCLRTYTRIEIEGFQKEETDKYVKFFFKEQDEKAEHVLKYIRQHPLVSEFLSGIPLFTAMLCELTNEIQTTVDDLDEFDTLSDLFRYFTSYLWGHYDTKSNTSRSQEESEKTLTRLLLHLGRVGLDGLFSPEKKLLFDSSDFILSEGHEDEKSYDQEVEELACKIGILSKHRRQVQLKTKLRQRTVTKSHAVSFFHKLSQEYCAGVYLSHLARTDEMAFLQYIRQICSRTQLLEYKNVLLFTCGEGIHSARLILDHLIALQEKWVYLWDTNNNTPDIALLCNLESKSDGELNAQLKRFLQSSNLKIWVSPFQHEPHIAVAYKYVLSSGQSLPLEDCDLCISKETNLHIFFDFMSYKNATSLTGLKLDVAHLKEEDYLRFLTCLQSFHHLRRLSLSVNESTHVSKLNKALGSCIYSSIQDLTLQNHSTDSLVGNLSFACDRFPNVEDLKIERASMEIWPKTTMHAVNLASLMKLSIMHLTCEHSPMRVFFELISQTCPILKELKVSVEDKLIHLERHAGGKIMEQLRCLGLDLKYVSNPFHSDDLMTMIASYAPFLQDITLDTTLEFKPVNTAAEVSVSSINHMVEFATLRDICKNEEDLRQILLYIPNVKSLKMIGCEPYLYSTGSLTTEVLAMKATQLEVNCSVTEFSDTIANHLVTLNCLQNSVTTTLSFLSSFQNLTSLSLINLPFRTLNLGECPKMPTVRHLKLLGFFLQCASGLRQFFDSFPNLVSCQVPYSVNDGIIGDLSDSIRERNDLRLLVLGIDSGITENVGKVVEAIASLPSLEHLVFRVHLLHDTLLQTLALALPVWTKLTFLGVHPYQMKFQTEPVGLEAMGAFADACVNHDQLSTIDLSSLQLTKEAALKVLGMASSAYGSSGQFSLRFTGPHLPCDWEVYNAVDVGRDTGYVTLVPPDKVVRYGEFYDGAGPKFSSIMCGVTLETTAKDAVYWRSIGCPDLDAIFGDQDGANSDTGKEHNVTV